MKKHLVQISSIKRDLLRGDILRCHSNSSHEDYVDLMIFETGSDPEYGLIIVSGYKSGLIFATMPSESIPQDQPGFAISKSWLIANWDHWGYTDCSIDKVYVMPDDSSIDED